MGTILVIVDRLTKHAHCIPSTSKISIHEKCTHLRSFVLIVFGQLGHDILEDTLAVHVELGPCILAAFEPLCSSCVLL